MYIGYDYTYLWKAQATAQAIYGHVVVVYARNMHINASRHGVVLMEVTVTNDIPKSYSREMSVTNDIPKAWHHVRMYALTEMWTWNSCLTLMRLVIILQQL